MRPGRLTALAAGVLLLLAAAPPPAEPPPAPPPARPPPASPPPPTAAPTGPPPPAPVPPAPGQEGEEDEEPPTPEVLPTFEFRAREAVEGTEWRLQLRGGLYVASGNSQSTSFSAGLAASRSDPDNLLSLEGGVALARSSVAVAVDTNGSGLVEEGEITRIVQSTSRAWSVGLRYDRFFAGANSLFASARANSDVPAGRALQGGTQLGYARHLYRTPEHEGSVEAGYDFQHERYVGLSRGAGVHSLRLAARHRSQLPGSNVLSLALEGLTNLDPERAPNPDGGERVPRLEDRRLFASAGLSTALGERLGFGFTFALRYDHVPPPRPPFLLPYAPGFRPFAERLDTTTEAFLTLRFF